MSAKKKKKVNHPYSADRPIASKKEDILNRSAFAARLAADIHSWDGDNSLVLALCGDWGSGKTSVKNMVVQTIQTNRAATLPVIDFNPWSLSGTGSIPSTFFKELAVALKRQGPERDIDKRSKKLGAYASSLAVAAKTVGIVGKIMPLAGLPGGPIIESLAEGLKTSGEVARDGSEALKAKAEAGDKTLDEQKRELAELLMRLPLPILIVIDDIDRLTTDEILQIFQLVKANADFPKLIYLLLFERAVVAKALDLISGAKGQEFLEKIVQVSYHVPLASPAAVQNVLFRRLDDLIQSGPAQRHWDQHRWLDLYDASAGYFINLRHVHRFLSSFSFHIKHHETKKSIEVNPIDLIGLEVLRVFEPSVYERLPGAKRVLTRYEGRRLFGEIKQETIDQAFSQIISVASPHTQKPVEKILKILFPPVTAIYSGKNDVTNHHQEWLRDIRICHPELFDKFFTLSIAADDLSQSELDNLLELTANAEKFALECDALAVRGLIHIAFQRLEAYKEHIPIENMAALTEGLCNIGDKFPVEKTFSLFQASIETVAFRLIYFGLRREPDLSKRFQLLRDAFLRSTGLALPIQIVSLDERVGDREAQGQQFLLAPGDLEQLKKICVERIRTASKADSFIKNPRFYFYLWRWSQWADQHEVRNWVAANITTVLAAVRLMTAFLQEFHSHGREHRVRYGIRLSEIERFADVDRLKRLFQKANKTALTKKQAKAVAEFEDALRRRAAGISEKTWEQQSEGYGEEIVE